MQFKALGPPTTTLRLRHSLQGWAMTGGTKETKKCEQYDSRPSLKCTIHHGPHEIRSTSVVRWQTITANVIEIYPTLTLMIIPVMPNMTPGAMNEATTPLHLWRINCHNLNINHLHKPFATISNYLLVYQHNVSLNVTEKTCKTNQPARRIRQLLKRGLDLLEGRRPLVLQ